MSRNNQVEFSNQPVVIDNGSSTVKVGFAGQDQPSKIIPSLIGNPKYKKVMGSNVDNDSTFFVGDKIHEMRGILKLKHPMSHVTHTVPVFEGFALQHAISRVDIGGRDITQHLQYLLRRSGYNFKTSAEMEVVRNIKEKNCYVAFDPQKEEELRELDSTTSKPVQTSYPLPDGNVIELGAEKFRAPELLFNPDIIGDESPGVHQCLNMSIHQSDIDLRKIFYSNIILGGGSTLFHGFGERLLHEVKKCCYFT
eukprot:gene15020-17764_t